MYELLMMIDPQVKDEERAKLVKKIEKIITDADGKIQDSKELGKKHLAYPVKKKTEAVYHLTNFSASPENSEKIKKKLNIEDKIMRFLLVKKAEITQKVSKKEDAKS